MDIVHGLIDEWMLFMYIYILYCFPDKVIVSLSMIECEMGMSAIGIGNSHSHKVGPQERIMVYHHVPFPE
jgi:hypothetical protein